MNPPSAESRASARVAVVGAETPAGGLIREALAGRKVPGRHVDLYGTATGEPVLSEYDGEARLIQEADPDEVAGHDVIFLCDRSEASNRLRRGAPAGALVIDLDGVAAGDPGAPLLLPGVNADALPARPRRVAVPHPLAIVLAELLHPLHGEYDVRRATAVVLRPASDFGKGGVEELREQTVRLLSFTPGPREVLGGQLAFNLMPQRLHEGDGEAGLEARLAREVGSLLGWDGPRLALRLVTVPVFYGHGVVLRVELAGAAAPADVVAALAGSARLRAADGAEATTPIEATGERRTTVSLVSEDGTGGFWLWAVVGEAQAAAADSAVALAEALSEL